VKRTTREKSADFSVPRKKQSFFLWKCGVSNPALHNENGKIENIFEKVKPEGHANEILRQTA